MINENAIRYGLNYLTQAPILVDRKSLFSPYGLIVGTDGAEKTEIAKREIENVLKYTEDEVLIIDYLSGYSSFAEKLNGQVITICQTDNVHINPLDYSMDYQDFNVLMETKFLLISALYNYILQSDDALSIFEKTLIGRACEDCYKAFKCNPEKSNLPTLIDLCNFLKKQPEEESQRLAFILKVFIQQDSSLYSNPTNIDIKKRLVVYNTMNVDKRLNSINMLIMLDQIQNRVITNKANGKQTWIYIDDAYPLLHDKNLSNFYRGLWRKGKHLDSVHTIITHSQSLLSSDFGGWLLYNIGFIILLNQIDTEVEKLGRLLNLNKEQLQHITKSEKEKGLLVIEDTVIPIITSQLNSTLTE